MDLATVVDEDQQALVLSQQVDPVHAIEGLNQGRRCVQGAGGSGLVAAADEDAGATVGVVGVMVAPVDALAPAALRRDLRPHPLLLLDIQHQRDAQTPLVGAGKELGEVIEPVQLRDRKLRHRERLPRLRRDDPQAAGGAIKGNGTGRKCGPGNSRKRVAKAKAAAGTMPTAARRKDRK